MKKLTPARILVVLAFAFGYPAFAHAHTGQAAVYDCASGLLHPLHGWDHLVAMVAIGMLAARYRGGARWLPPGVFVAVMCAAAGLGAQGIALPQAETFIAISLVLLGLLIAAPNEPPLAAVASVAALAAAAHGFAHGAEIPATAAALPYAAGIVVSTAILHGLGLLAGTSADRRFTHLTRLAGGACAAAGAVLLSA